MATFRQNLKRALDEVQENGYIKSYTMGPKPSYLVKVVTKTLAEIEADENIKQ